MQEKVVREKIFRKYFKKDVATQSFTYHKCKV